MKSIVEDLSVNLLEVCCLISQWGCFLRSHQGAGVTARRKNFLPALLGRVNWIRSGDVRI